MRCCRELLDSIGRRQPWDARSLQQTPFRRSLRMLDLMGLGIGSCGGLGVYVLSAHVTRHEAGPSSVLSVIIAGVTSLLAGLCHAELAGRLPRASTGYSYCYVTLGELSAFVVGWTMVLEHAITAAVSAKAWRHYLDYMVNDTLSGEVEEVATWKLPEVFASHPDVLACVIMLVVSLASFLSVKAFSIVTLCLVMTSGLVLLALVCVGYFHVQSHNWTQPPGFFAFGFAGMLSGASLLMSVFSGVDQVAAASQETRDPSRNLPAALPLTTSLLFLTLLLATSALTLACPWQGLTERAPLARAFETKGIYAANHVIGAGALLGLAASAMSGLYHPPRILLAMAGDGLLPRCLGKTSMSNIPLVGSLLSGVLASLLALTLDFSCLIEMSAVGTVIQFMTSALIVLYVRYQPDPLGLCKEYSDIDLSLVGEEEGERGEEVPSVRSESPKLVLMANGDLHVHYHDHPHLNNNSHHNHQQRQDTSLKEALHQGIKANSEPPKGVGERGGERGGKGGGGGGGGDKGGRGGREGKGVGGEGEGWGKGRGKEGEKGEEGGRERGDNSATLRTEFKESSRLFPPSTTGGTGPGAGAGLGTGGEVCRRVMTRSPSTFSSLVPLSSCTKLVPDSQTWQSTRYLLLVFLLSATCLAATTALWPVHPGSSWWAVTMVAVSMALMVAAGLGMARQPQSEVRLFFKAPYVPLLPLLCVLLCALLMSALPALAWLRLAVWTAAGLVIYFTYGIRKSVHRSEDEQEVVLFDISNRTY